MAAAISPDGKSLYTTNEFNNTVSQFSVNPSTGQIAALSPATIATAGYPASIVVSVDGKSVYVGCQSQYIYHYSRASSGLLTLVLAMPATNPNNGVTYDLTSIFISPDGLNLYGVNGDASRVFQYTINQSGGALTGLLPFVSTSPGYTRFGEVSPNGNFAYVRCTTNNLIYQFSRIGGLLAALGTATIAVGGGAPVDMGISPDGNYLYVVTQGNLVAQYAIAANGQLSDLSPFTVATATGATGILIA
jgi:6-phosphogluconolactonase (cycloisomerase 2 family)